MISGCIWNNGFIMSEDLLPGGEIETLSCLPHQKLSLDHYAIAVEFYVMFHRVQMKGEFFIKHLKFKLDVGG